MTGADRRFRLRSLVAAVVVLLGAAGLGGCAAARNELGTNASSCYVDLALAGRAVHHEGRLRGVRLVTIASLRPHARLLYKAAVADRKRVGQVCLVAFGGHFHRTRVDLPIGRETGLTAVVELGYPDRRLLATLIVTRPPLAFAHFHL